MEIREIQGVYAAAVTPRGKNGDIDFGAAFELVDFLCKGGVNGIALFTGAGEFAALAPDERSRLVYLAVKRSRVPVLAGVGSATLDSSVALAREARDAGAAGLLLPPPFFFPYEQDDIAEFCLQFAAQVGSKAVTFLSHVPGSTSRIEVATALELFATGHFAGIEDATGDAETFFRLKAASGAGGFRVLVGHDASFARARAMGAHGAISAIAGAVPELMAALDKAIAAGKRDEIAALDGQVQEFHAWLQRLPPAAILKTAVGLRGVKTGPPAVPVSRQKQKLLDEFRAWFQTWLPAVKKLAAHA